MLNYTSKTNVNSFSRLKLNYFSSVPLNSDAHLMLLCKIEKVEKYQNVAWETRWMWNVATNVIELAIGALHTVTKKYEKHVREIPVATRVEVIQKPNSKNHLKSS